MSDLFDCSLKAVQKWVEARNYKGYDPGDGLTSFLRPLTFGNLFAERLLQQFIWKAPINLRPLVGVVPLDSTKGRGFMAWGYVLMCKAHASQGYREKATKCLDWLQQHSETGHAGYCWGNHFDFTTRSGRMKAHTPTIVWSGLIGQAFIDAYETTGASKYLDVADSICEWILSLPREITSEGVCLSYTGAVQNSVHNSNLLGAAMLSRTWRYRPREEYRTVASAAVSYSCNRQRPDGSWWYGEDPKYQWIDSFHTAYNLDCLKRYTDSTSDEKFRENMTRGYRYYRENFFEESGRPKYYHDRTYPVDIQCAAQAIDTFCYFVSEDDKALPMAEKVARWTIKNMQDKSGYFYYRQYPFVKSRTPYFHWGQATMFKALANLLLTRSECKHSNGISGAISK